MARSARVCARDRYTRADGTNQVCLLVIIQRVSKWLPLDLHWPAKFFAPAAGKALPRRRGDKEADDLNLQAGQELARVNKIFVEWRLREQALTMPEFLKEFNSKLNRGNFCDYFATKLEERYRTEEISELSYKAQRATLRKVLEFNPNLPFTNLKAGQFAKKFDLWLEKKKGSGANTRWTRHKDVKTYLHLAEQDNIRFDWPYEDYKVPKVAGQWVAAQEKEIELLDAYYDTLRPGTTRRRYLRRWLFGVATGLRVSDQRQAKRDWLIDTTLVFHMHKGRRKGKVVKIPLGERAMELVQDALYAIEQGLPLPIGPQDAELLDTDFTDEDDDNWTLTAPDEVKEETTGSKARDAVQLRHAAGRVYHFLQQHRAKRFRWLRLELMRPGLKKHLLADVDELLRVLALSQAWSAERDVKVQQLRRLLLEQHPHQKVLLFSQFADTVRYLHTALAAEVPSMAAVTGATEDPTALAYRFSPVSNDKREQVKPPSMATG